jgi:hypothetical protein
MKFLKLIPFALMPFMVSCNSAEKESVKPRTESTTTARTSGTASTSTSCDIATGSYAGQNAINAMQYSLSCTQLACLHDAEYLGYIPYVMDPNGNMGSSYNKIQLDAFVATAKATAAAQQPTVCPNNPSHGQPIYRIEFIAGQGLGNARKIEVRIHFTCCDDNIIIED